MANASRPAPGAASLRLLQSLAIGVELANGWHTWHEVLNRGDMLALPLCIGGLLLGGALTHAASLKSGAQAAVGSSLFWLSCTLSGGLLAIAQLRLRLQTANEDAFFVNALVSSALLGCCLPHAVREMLVCPSVEVLMPCIFAVLVTEVVCCQDAFPQFQALAGLFLLLGGLQGLAVADVSRLSPAETKTGAAVKAPRAAERQGGPAKEKEPPADPFFPATVLESQKYSPHFMGGDPLLQLVARQAPEAQRGKAKASGGSSLLASMDLAKAYDFAEPMAGIIMLRWHKRHTSHGCERCAMIRPQWKEVASALGDQLDAECCGKEDIRLFWLPSAARFAGCLAHFCTFFAMYFCFVFCFHGLESYGQWEKAPIREPVPFDPLPGEAPPKPLDPTTRNRRHSETSEATQLSQPSQGSQGAAAAEDSHAADEDAPEAAAGEPMEEMPEDYSSALLEKLMVARPEEDAPGDGEGGSGARASRETATEVRPSGLLFFPGKGLKGTWGAIIRFPLREF
eukprot:s3036_g6.t1